MLLNTEQLNNRLDSPNNLINRLRHNKSNGIELFGAVSKSSRAELIIPVLPSSELDEVEREIKNGLVKSKAREILGDSLNYLHRELPNVDSSRELSNIAQSMSKIIESFEPKKDSHTPGNLVIWKPVMVNENHYESVIAFDQ